MNDQAAAYVSAVDSFERMARTFVLNSQGSTKSTDMVTEASPATSEPSATARASSSKAPVATTQQQPKVKRLTLQKPNAELRRGRIIRPQLGKPEEPQVDTEMPEAEGAGGEGKQPSSHVTESQGTTVVPPVQTHVRKRQADSLASEQPQATQGEASTEIVPPASKKPKGSETEPDTAEGDNLSKEPDMDETMDATTAAEDDNEETEADIADEETVEAQQENEAEEGQDKADEPVEENPTKTETIPTEEEFKDQTEQENQDLADAEFDKEEGELDLDTLEDLEEPTDVATTPMQSPIRMETTMEEAETTIEPPLEDVKNDEGGDVAVEEASDKPNNGNNQQVAETDLKPGTTSASATPPTSSTPETEETKRNRSQVAETTVAATVSASTTPASAGASETPETSEETKRAASPSRTINIADKAKEKAAIRQAGVAALGGTRTPSPANRAPSPPAPRGRGRIVNTRGGGRVNSRGGRTTRGGRGPPPSQP